MLFILLLRCTQGLVGLGTEVSLNLGIIPGILDPLLSYKNLLDSLRKNNKGIPYKKIYMYDEIIIIKKWEG